MKDWYKIDQQRKGLFRKWQSIGLSKHIKETAEKERVWCFSKSFFSTYSDPTTGLEALSSWRFLSYQLIIAVDIPNIQQALRKGVPTVHRIPTLLSNEPGAAGSHISDNAMMSINGTTEKIMEKHWKDQDLTEVRIVAPDSDLDGHLEGLLASMVAGFVGKTIEQKKKHGNEERMEAIDKHRSKQPNAMLCVEDLALISNYLIENGE